MQHPHASRRPDRGPTAIRLGPADTVCRPDEVARRPASTPHHRHSSAPGNRFSVDGGGGGIEIGVGWGWSHPAQVARLPIRTGGGRPHVHVILEHSAPGASGQRGVEANLHTYSLQHQRPKGGGQLLSRSYELFELTNPVQRKFSSRTVRDFTSTFHDRNTLKYLQFPQPIGDVIGIRIIPPTTEHLEYRAETISTTVPHKCFSSLLFDGNIVIVEKRDQSIQRFDCGQKKTETSDSISPHLPIGRPGLLDNRHSNHTPSVFTVTHPAAPGELRAVLLHALSHRELCCDPSRRRAASARNHALCRSGRLV